MTGMTHRLLHMSKLRVLALAVLVIPLALVSTTQVTHATAASPQPKLSMRIGHDCAVTVILTWNKVPGVTAASVGIADTGTGGQPPSGATKFTAVWPGFHTGIQQPLTATGVVTINYGLSDPVFATPVTKTTDCGNFLLPTSKWS